MKPNSLSGYIKFAESCKLRAQNKFEGLGRVGDEYKMAVIEPIFEYSDTLRIREKSLDNGIFDFKENMDLLDSFAYNVKNGINKKLKILLNEDFDRNYFNFFKQYAPYRNDRVELRISSDGPQVFGIFGDNRRFIMKRPDSISFVYGFNSVGNTKDFINDFDKEFSKSKTLIL